MVLGLLAFNVHAVTIQECVDENNQKTYQKTCPPGSSSVNSLKLKTGKPSKPKAQEPSDVEITIYTVPKCDSCAVMRNVLEIYGANFTEVNIENNVELQNELNEKIGAGGSLKVPTVIFGEKQIVGLNKASLISELEAAGYKEKGGGDAKESTTTDEET